MKEIQLKVITSVSHRDPKFNPCPWPTLHVELIPLVRVVHGLFNFE